jgi:hypothetical protein
VREFREREGVWRLCSARADLCAPALELARVRRDAPEQASAPAELAGTRAWYGHEHLRGGARWRLALRRLPALVEYANLEWLRARAFLAPRPLAAGGLFRGGLPAYQFLLSESIEPAETLTEFLARRDDPLRAEVLEELARELARLHALHFVRRGFSASNVLVQREGRAGRITFLGGRAGAPLEDARALLAGPEQERFLAHYAEERAAQSPTGASAAGR